MTEEKLQRFQVNSNFPAEQVQKIKGFCRIMGIEMSELVFEATLHEIDRRIKKETPERIKVFNAYMKNF